MNTINKNRRVLYLFDNHVLRNVFRFAGFKSAISVEDLYPGCNLKLTTPQEPINDDKKFTGYIPMDKIHLTYSKSTGPGGQNVNKVNTKVDLRFHVESATWLDPEIKKKLAVNLKTKITNEGFLIIRSDVTRSQQLNVADCLEKLRCAIREAAYSEPVQTQENAERLRRRYEKAVTERLMIKRHRSQIKEDRKNPTVYDT